MDTSLNVHRVFGLESLYIFNPEFFFLFSFLSSCVTSPKNQNPGFVPSFNYSTIRVWNGFG